MPNEDRTRNLVPIQPVSPRAIKVSPGERYGRWTVIGGPLGYKEPTSGRRLVYYPCKCDCGTIRDVAFGNLKHGISTSCGCYKRDWTAARFKTHGMEPRRLYEIWKGMKSRCLNPNVAQYANYGGRGIAVCPEWSASFVPFRDWALANGYQPDLTLEREDNDVGYNPSNCTWIPGNMQSRNQRSNCYLTAFGEAKIRARWLEDPRCVVGKATLFNRLRLGWDAETALSRPAGLANGKYVREKRTETL